MIKHDIIDLNEWLSITKAVQHVKNANPKIKRTRPGICYAIDVGHIEFRILYDTFTVVKVSSLDQYIRDCVSGKIGPGKRLK